MNIQVFTSSKSSVKIRQAFSVTTLKVPLQMYIYGLLQVKCQCSSSILFDIENDK